jgi:hypothetical protein
MAGASPAMTVHMALKNLIRLSRIVITRLFCA